MVRPPGVFLSLQTMKEEYCMTITLYSTEACPGCFGVKRSFDTHGIEYNEVRLDQDPDALKFVKEELGYFKAPVVTVEQGGEITDSWTGFVPAKVQQYA